MKEAKLKYLMEMTGLSKEEVLKQEKQIQEMPAEKRAELEKEVRVKEKFLCNLLPAMLIGQAAIKSGSPKAGGLTNMMQFGSGAQEYCEKFNCSMSQFITEMKGVHRSFIDQSLKVGCAFDEKAHNLRPDQKKKNRENQKTFKKEKQQESRREKEGRGMSIGEILKRKKEQ